MVSRRRFEGYITAGAASLLLAAPRLLPALAPGQYPMPDARDIALEQLRRVRLRYRRFRADRAEQGNLSWELLKLRRGFEEDGMTFEEIRSLADESLALVNRDYDTDADPFKPPSRLTA
jgi:hypothetical protein